MVRIAPVPGRSFAGYKRLLGCALLTRDHARTPQRLNREIDVEIEPVQMMRTRELDASDLTMDAPLNQGKSWNARRISFRCSSTSFSASTICLASARNSPRVQRPV